MLVHEVFDFAIVRKQVKIPEVFILVATEHNVITDKWQKI